MAKLLFYALGACGGCELLALEQELVSLLEDHEVYVYPLLSSPPGGSFSFDIAVISGAVLNQEHQEFLRDLRARSRFLVALGTCATHGGIPALVNERRPEERFEEVYPTPFRQKVLKEGLPLPLPYVKALDELVKVDVALPGCPPDISYVLKTTQDLLKDTIPRFRWPSVCETCPYERSGKRSVRRLQRLLAGRSYPLKERCFLEQGILCLGPVTALTCVQREPPLCLAAHMPCRGCGGPVRAKANPMLDMLNALVGNKIDWRSWPDRKLILAFAGAHGHLRPLKGPQCR